MQINTLYLPLKEVTGKLEVKKHFTFNTLEHIRKRGAFPKYGRHGYSNRSVHASQELSECIEDVLEIVSRKLVKLSKKNKALTSQLSSKEIPHWSTTGAEWNTAKCRLLHAITFLCRAKVDRGNRTNIEVQFYHINTHWLTLNQLAYGKDTAYRNQANVAHLGNFIPMKDRFYGRRSRA